MKRIYLGFALCLVFVLLFSQQALPQTGERLVLTTYYPAPFGVYREMQILGQNGEQIILKEDASQNASMVLYDNGPSGMNPYIGLQNNSAPAAGGMPDCYFQLQDDNTLRMVCGLGPLQPSQSDPTKQVGPGLFRILSRDPAGRLVPGRLEVGEILICGD
ncbi:MAG: hypothetical protein JW867_02945 [Candidatus Omnitrophica bacterium]|nr:hypothetical protein [Candidatus Omnitrophota bacterium]